MASCARWITPYLETGGIQPSGNAYAGVCSYRRIFSLDPICMDWAQVNFSYLGGDNKIIGFKLNGHSYTLNPPTSNDYIALNQNISFAINTSHLVAGPNTIVIQVNNVDSYTGFFVCGGLTINFCSPAPIHAKKVISKFEGLTEPVKIYPNPGTGLFALKLSAAEKGTVNISDITGRSVHHFDLLDQVTVYPFDLSTLPKGVYIVTIRTATVTETQKIVLE